MATARGRTQCFICNNDKNLYKCEICTKDFCRSHLTEHRHTLSQQFDKIEYDCDQFQQTLLEQKRNPQNCSLIEQINQWEQKSILKIKQTANECRQSLMKYQNKHINQLENRPIQLTQQLRQIHEEDEFNEIDLNHLKDKLSQIIQSSHISIREDSSAAFINKISVILSSEKFKWKRHGITVAGGYGPGNQMNQLDYPQGIFIDSEKTVYIADWQNHRIVQWKYGDNKGRVVAGGNGKGTRIDQLNHPVDIIVDKENDSLNISDRGNRRVIRWSIQNKTNQEILMSDIDCGGLTMDNNGCIYISDTEKHEVRRYKEGDTNGRIVAGGNGKGEESNELNCPTKIFVDEDYSLYVLDVRNHRVMKWEKNAKDGNIVAGGNGDGKSLSQLSYPRGVIVDHLGQIYVADYSNHRVMRWSEGNEEGEIVVGENGQGEKSNQLDCPSDLSFDVEGNLYVADSSNNRIQKFEINF